MKPSSSTSSSKYRVHSPSDTVPRSHSARSRGSGSRGIGDTRDQQVAAYSPSSTPASDYNLYDSRGYSVQPYLEHHRPSSYPSHHTYQSPPPHSHGIPPSHQHPSYSSPHPVHPQAYHPQHHPTYPSYDSPQVPPAPPAHGHLQQHPSYPSSQSLTPYSSGHSHAQSSQSHYPSQESDLSQYSLSGHKPRYRIEQEGQNLVVLPSEDDPPSSSSSSQSSLPSVSPPPSPPLQLCLPAAAVPQQSFRAIRAPPREWPPTRYQTELSTADARKFISDGAPKFRGELREITNGPRGHYYLFAFSGDEWDEESDTAPFQSDSFCDMSSSPEGKQTDALERPAMAHAFGIYPGTLTLSYYVASFGSTLQGHEVAARGKVRKLTMLYVLDRLRILQVKGIEEDHYQLHMHLYDHLLHDTHRYDSKIHVSLDNQISDLVAALCRPSWVNFSSPESQTIARFLTDPNPSVANSFFHQLLLSIELYLRVSARDQANLAAKPLPDMPEKIRWDLMLAQRWLENVEVEPPKKVKDSKGKWEQKSNVGFKFPHKKTQVEALRNFAWTLKWPNMHEVEYTLSEDEGPNEVLEDRSIDCMSWFTGLLLPGKSMSWILMNSLTDCDPDVPETFHNLSQMTPNVGFQYRGHTYWSWECIVGKVLGAAAGVAQIAGWIGPCSASADLGRSEMAIINQVPPRGNKIAPSDVRNMAQNSDPLGAYQTTYPVDDYILLTQNTDDPVEDIRIERLNFSPTASSSEGGHRITENGHQGSEEPPVLVFDASITFAITTEHRARSWKVSLRHDTPFIAAYPCQNGPHVLYCEYQHKVIYADKLVDIQNWGPSGGGEDPEPEDENEQPDNANVGVEEVLVVEAFGVPDNEVFARAWCSFWGLPAVTADINKTCMACAIREAYAALVSVVILTNRSSITVEVEEVDRLMENL